MAKPFQRQVALSALIAGICVLAGWNPQGYFLSPAYAGTKPSMPTALGYPTMPIMSGSGDLGYLPGSGGVKPDGQYTYSIPIEVPAGRAGMQPSLSLSYTSQGGSGGVLGVGWSLSGLSAITRCGLTLATEGVVRGVHHTSSVAQAGFSSDRFCLDGKKLIVINGQYGLAGTEYRTEEDSYAQIIATQDPQNPGVSGDLIFTVKTKGGHTLVYTGSYAPQATQTLYGQQPIAFFAPANWLLSTDTDAAGNGIQYNYSWTPNSFPTSWGGSYQPFYEALLTSIVYTTHTTSSGVIDAPGERTVTLNYTGLPAANGAPTGGAGDFGFQDGVATGVFHQLTSITMSAPSPTKGMTATIPVWEYLITYSQSDFSKRQLLSTVQRCALTAGAALGGCTWKKTFAWAQSANGAAPRWSGNWQTVWSGTVGGLNVQTPDGLGTDGGEAYFPQPNPSSNPEYNEPGIAFFNFSSFQKGFAENPPVIRVLDADGDGRDDVLFQTGGPGSPNVLLLTSGSEPVATINSTMGFYDPSHDPASGGDRQALQNTYAVDINGNGISEIYTTQATVTNGQIICQGKVLQWLGGGGASAVGFGDLGLNLPTYDCANPAQTNLYNMFMDLDGDGRLDHVQSGPPDTFGGPTGLGGNSNASLDFISAALPGDWQTAEVNQGGKWGPITSIPTGNGFGGFSAGCQNYVVDFTGDGIGQLFDQVGFDSANHVDIQDPADDPDSGGADPIGIVWADGIINCSSSLLGTYRAGAWTVVQDTTGKYPVIPQMTVGQSDPAATNVQPGNVAADASLTPRLIFGDFNGDGLEDVIEPSQGNPNVLALRWSTGQGFGPEIPLTDTPWYHTSGLIDYQVSVVDINHDGRADLVVFHESPHPGITIMLSNGDGTFTSQEEATLLNSQNQLIPDDPGMVASNCNCGPGSVAGPNGTATILGAIGDFNGDGYADLIRLEPVTTGTPGQESTSANLQVMTQVPVIADRVISVTDEGSAWPREAVTYSLQWSDKPEPVTPCAYPLHCIRRGFPVVREVDYRDALVDVQSVAQISSQAHRVYYSYEDPVSDARGRGSLGFRKVRQWDPSQPRQTITEYDNRTCGPSVANCTAVGNFYPGAGRPQRVTTVVPIPAAGSQTPPVVGLNRGGVSSVNARVSQTTYAYNNSYPYDSSSQAYNSYGYLTYVVQPTLQTTAEWEQTVMMDASVTDAADPTSDYIWNTNANPVIVAPAKPLRVHTTSFDSYDAYGNVLQSTDTTVGGIQSVTTASYTNTPSTWQIGLLNWSSTTTTDNGVPVTHQAQYTYDPITGLLQTSTRLQQETAQTNPASITLGTPIATTTLGRDSYGNITSVSTTASVPNASSITRQVNIEYDPLWPGQPNERIFPSQTWVPSTLPGPGGTTWQPSAWTLVHPAYGVVSAAMDANGVQATNSYDDQGRLVSAAPAGEAPLSISYAPRMDLYTDTTNGMIVTAMQIGQTVTVASDADGRTLVSSHVGFDGTVINDAKMTYDTFGRTLTASRPYQGSTPTYQTSYLYDGLSRVLSVTAPDSTAQQPVVTTSAPTFFTATTTDPNGNQTQIKRDVNGRVVSSANLLNGGWVTTNYQYNPLHALQTSVIDPNGNVESTMYDSLGRVTSHVSPDMGTTTNLVYDGLDELLSSTHQNSGAITSHSYDTLGRMTSWNTTAGTDGGIATSATLTYDTQPNGLGKLATAVSSDNVTTLAHYDSYGRATGMDETVGGQTYSTGEVYNSLGQVSQVNYPGIGGSTSPWIALQNTYNASGYLSEVDYSVNGATSSLPPLWRVVSRNLDDALVQATFGSTAYIPAGPHKPPVLNQLAVTIQNSYLPATGRPQQLLATPATTTNPILNLSYSYYPNGLVQTRSDAVNGRLESFQYDSVNRLTNWNLSTSTCTAVPCAPPATAASWQQYGYDNTGNLLQVSKWSGQWNSLQTNSYGGGGGGPHALSSQTNAGVASSYNYDTHGRQTTGSSQTLTYNAYDLPKVVTYNGNTWKLLYDAFGHRVQKSGTDGTTVYVGDLYEKRTTVAGVLDVFHVPGGQLEYNEASGNLLEYGEFTDALGSVGTVFNGSGGALGTTGQPFFYDPFGARTTINGVAPYTGTIGDVHDGFTGQEHDDQYGLINFRGRTYNPTLKRFLSPDPHVTSPGFGQSWNPYSYVNNSPLNATDPSGFDDAPSPPDYRAGVTVSGSFSVTPGTSGPASGTFCSGPGCGGGAKMVDGGGKGASDISLAGLSGIHNEIPASARFDGGTPSQSGPTQGNTTSVANVPAPDAAAGVASASGSVNAESFGPYYLRGMFGLPSPDVVLDTRKPSDSEIRCGAVGGVGCDRMTEDQRGAYVVGTVVMDLIGGIGPAVGEVHAANQYATFKQTGSPGKRSPLLRVIETDDADPAILDLAEKLQRSGYGADRAVAVGHGAPENFDGAEGGQAVHDLTTLGLLAGGAGKPLEIVSCNLGCGRIPQLVANSGKFSYVVAFKVLATEFMGRPIGGIEVPAGTPGSFQVPNAEGYYMYVERDAAVRVFLPVISGDK